MKSVSVVATERPRSGRILGVRKDSGCSSIMKKSTASIDFRGEKLNVSDEMKECFLKLSDMVPEVPLNEEGNIDGTVLMQYVIDYILDLELQLDGQVTYSPASFSASFQSKLASEASSREPLSEKSLENIVSTQVQTRCPSSFSEESLFRTLPDVDSRPPSK